MTAVMEKDRVMGPRPNLGDIEVFLKELSMEGHARKMELARWITQKGFQKREWHYEGSK